VRYIVHRFADAASMETWEKSETRAKLLQEANQYSKPFYEKATGLETWFTVPGLHAIVAPPRWKMAMITMVAAYFLSLIASIILGPFLIRLPLPASNLIMTLILVIGLTYFLMPSLSNLLKRWLYPNQD